MRLACGVWCVKHTSQQWTEIECTAQRLTDLDSVCAWLYFQQAVFSRTPCCAVCYAVCYAVCSVAFFAWICRNVYFKHGWLCYSRFVFNARSVCTVYTQKHYARRLFSSFVRSISFYFSLLFPNRFRCCPFKCHLLFLSIFMNGFCFRRAAVVVFQRLCSFERNPFISSFHILPYHIRCYQKWFAFRNLYSILVEINRKRKPLQIPWNSFVKNSSNHKNDWW